MLPIHYRHDLANDTFANGVVDPSFVVHFPLAFPLAFSSNISTVIQTVFLGYGNLYIQQSALWNLGVLICLNLWIVLMPQPQERGFVAEKYFR